MTAREEADSRAFPIRFITPVRSVSHWFAEQFPEKCPDGGTVCSTDTAAFGDLLQGLIPNLTWPLQTVPANPEPWSRNEASIPTTDTVLDLVDFLVQRASEPIHTGTFHAFFGHHELRFDREAGKKALRDDINELFRRNCVAYQIGTDLRTGRTVPIDGTTVMAALVQPCNGDSTLDRLLADAVKLFQSSRQSERKLALDRLFDAFVRIKTIDTLTGKTPDKAILTEALLDQVAPPTDYPVMARTRC